MYIPWRCAYRALTVGIDIDANRIKLIALKKRGSISPIFELISYAHVTTTLEFPSISEAVQNALQKAGVHKKSKIIIALPYGQVLVKTMLLPVSDDLSILHENIIAYCKQIITYPIHDACIDFEVSRSSTNNSVERDVRVVIARRDAVEEKINMLGLSGFLVSAVDVESDALARSICYGLNGKQKDGQQKIMIAIHIGSQKILGLVIYKEKILFVQEIVVCVVDAGGIKIEHFLDKIKTLHSILSLFVDNFLKKEKLILCVSNRIYLSGTLCVENDFMVKVGSFLNKFPCLVDPFSNMKIKESIDLNELERNKQSLIISCGLAMREFL